MGGAEFKELHSGLWAQTKESLVQGQFNEQNLENFQLLLPESSCLHQDWPNLRQKWSCQQELEVVVSLEEGEGETPGKTESVRITVKTNVTPKTLSSSLKSSITEVATNSLSA